MGNWAPVPWAYQGSNSADEQKCRNSGHGQLGFCALGSSTWGGICGGGDEKKSWSSKYGQLGLSTLGLNSQGGNGGDEQKSWNSSCEQLG